MRVKLLQVAGIAVATVVLAGCGSEQGYDFAAAKGCFQYFGLPLEAARDEFPLGETSTVLARLEEGNAVLLAFAKSGSDGEKNFDAVRSSLREHGPPVALQRSEEEEGEEEEGETETDGENESDLSGEAEAERIGHVVVERDENVVLVWSREPQRDEEQLIETCLKR
jgi:hypothetical protein